VAEVRRFADLDALSRAAAEDFGALVRDAVRARGVCHVALSGGSTPKRLFQLLAAQGRAALPWDQVELWWGDERTVPPTHPDSNYRMTQETLLEPLGLTQVHRISGEHEPWAAAAAYERKLVAALGAPPVLDLALQGMGPDGHTASLFPGTPALDDTTHWVVANPVDSPVAKGKTVRVTLTARAINAARHVRFLVAGADKAAPLAAVLEGARDPHRYPSQLVSGADVVWYVDAAAAAELGGAR
jgi:6-phosphogluconolactonase